MKKGLIPVTLGVAVTMAGLSVELINLNKEDLDLAIMQIWQELLLVGAGVAHIALGAIDMLKE